jgi:replicative DNA helicase
LDRGETIDVSKGLAALARLEKEQRVFVPMSEVEPEKVIWHPTYYNPIDEYVGGIPDSGLIVVGGPPGTGKTTFLSKLLINMAKNGKKTAFFSLEMTMNQVMFRALQIDSKFKTKKVQKNLLIADDVFTVDEIYSHASRLKAAHPDLYMIGVDFADMIAPTGRGRDGVDAVDNIYKTLARLAKKIRVPVMVLSQLNYNYVGGRPRVNHLRGSRLIEALGALVLLLWNPDTIDVEQKDEVLQVHPGIAYIIVGKSRFGFHNPTESVGAIQVEFKKEKGWADKANGWFGLGSA